MDVLENPDFFDAVINSINSNVPYSKICKLLRVDNSVLNRFRIKYSHLINKQAPKSAYSKPDNKIVNDRFSEALNIINQLSYRLEMSNNAIQHANSKCLLLSKMCRDYDETIIILNKQLEITQKQCEEYKRKLEEYAECGQCFLN